MNFDDLRKTLPALAAMTVVCIGAGYVLYGVLHDHAAEMTVKSLELFLMLIPAVLIFIGSFITLFFGEVNKTVLAAIVAVSVLAGMIGLGAVSTWYGDASFTAAVLANSDPDVVMTSPIGSPFKVFRGFALFAFVPIVGSIAGAWVGSRIGFTQ